MLPSLIDELRARVSIAEVIARRISLKRQGRRFVALCPFHEEKTPSFILDDQRGFFHCFGCGARGDVIEFIKQYEHLSFVDALEKLASEFGIQVTPSALPARHSPGRMPKPPNELDELYSLLEIATCWFQEQLRSAEGSKARVYLQRRGVDESAIKRFRLGYAPRQRYALAEAMSGFPPERMRQAGLIRTGSSSSQSFFWERIIFPITDQSARVVAFGGRALQEVSPKYLNSPETTLFHKGKTLYGATASRASSASSGSIQGGESSSGSDSSSGKPLRGQLSRGKSLRGKPPEMVVIVEGYMDVIALTSAGFIALSPLGTALTEAQILALWKLAPGPEHLPILCFDGDSSGRLAAFRALDRILPLLRPDHSLGFAFLPQDYDPDLFVREQGAEAFQLLLRQSCLLIDLLWEQESNLRPLDSPENRAGLEMALHRRTEQIGDHSVRRFYRQRLQARLARLRQSSGRSSPVGHLASRAVLPQRPTPAPDQRARTMLATIINHPVLFEEFSEPFAHYSASSQVYRQLQQAILEIFLAGDQRDSGHGAISHGDSDQNDSGQCDRKWLIRELQRRGFAEFLDELLHNVTYNVASFSNPESSSETAQWGLQDLFLMADRL